MDFIKLLSGCVWWCKTSPDGDLWNSIIKDSGVVSCCSKRPSSFDLSSTLRNRTSSLTLNTLRTVLMFCLCSKHLLCVWVKTFIFDFNRSSFNGIWAFIFYTTRSGPRFHPGEVKVQFKKTWLGPWFLYMMKYVPTIWIWSYSIHLFPVSVQCFHVAAVKETLTPTREPVDDWFQWFEGTGQNSGHPLFLIVPTGRV